MGCLRINQTIYPYEQLCIDLPNTDLTEWLLQQTLYPKVYWQDRDTRIEHAAVGNILIFTAPPIFDTAPDYDVRFYGGMHFPSVKQDSLWDGFLQSAFWLPRFEMIQTQKKTQLILHFFNEKASLSLLQAVHFELFRPLSPSTPYSLIKKEDSLSKDQWQKHISHLLTVMDKQKIHKVVLGRKTQLSFSHSPCAWHIIKHLKERAERTTVFAFQLRANVTFLGASPEQFFHRKGGHVFIDAIAGTRKRGQSQEEDLLFEKELKTHSKEKREFFLVKDFIQNTAYPLSEKCIWHLSDTILKTASVQHLYNQATITLKKGISDPELINAFHPTPAVGGFPKKKALKLIGQLESFQRGWYAAPIGWISFYETHLIVAIRSCLLQDAVLHLFGAAGIVSESIAEKEWEEIDHKMNTCMQAFTSWI